jgi:protein-L-isoaspartate(D-aspartate) O-methyltransferase
MAMTDDFERARLQMVETQLERRGVRDTTVLDAMRRVPRHLFVAPALQDRAYDDTPLPIGEQQTISQPYMVALMSEALDLRAGERVLEIGTGSGYQTAVLAELGARVVSLERIPALAERARRILHLLGYDDRVQIEVGDGTLGWAARAPYDGVVVTAGAPQIPRPLVEQLAEDGRLVLPMGDDEVQTLVRIQRGPEGLAEEYLGECRFVKLLGSYGWEDP